MDPVEALTRMGGVAQRAALLSCTTKHALRAACAEGGIVRAGHGIYALPAADEAKVAAARAELEGAALASARTGRKRELRVIRSATPKSANPFESALRAIAETVPGLVVVPQGEVGTIGHADLADPSLRIAIEADSFGFHAVREAFEYDVRRYTAMIRAGWLVVRFTWDDVMHKPDYVRAVLVDIVALRTAA